jgi:hypothetical protein
MSVVVDQFEVVPTQPESGDRPTAAPAAPRAQSFMEDVERELRTRAERAARLEAS